MCDAVKISPGEIRYLVNLKGQALNEGLKYIIFNSITNMSDQKVTSPHNFEISSGRKVTQREIKISTTTATAQ